MIPRPVSLALTAALLTGCGGATAPLPDPQEPAPPPSKGQPLRPSQIVICPDGSSYDTTRNSCVATRPISPDASKPPGTSSLRAGASAGASVRCTFTNGWVSLVPVDAYPADDTFLMQALIGLTEEPDFWGGESEYAALEPYAARRCSDSPQRFNLPAGEYFVVVGEAGTFNRRGTYDRNGFRRRIRLSDGSPQEVTVRRTDLTLTWSCISCPFVSFFDPASGRWLKSFVVLAYRDSASRRGTDRVLVERVPVRNGRIKLRVAEAEPEISQLDQLVLEVHGQRLLPTRGDSRSALASADGAGVELRPGTQIDVEYQVPGMGDGFVDVQVVAHGHYDPL